MPPGNHAHPWQPRMPPGNHACPHTTTHAPWQPCMPPSNHACPQQPCIPPATVHAPSGNHTCPPQPCMPPGKHACTPGNHACPPATTHTSPPATTHAPPPPVNRMTNRCKNITLPQTSFGGGNYTGVNLGTFFGCSILAVCDKKWQTYCSYLCAFYRNIKLIVENIASMVTVPLIGRQMMCL